MELKLKLEDKYDVVLMLSMINSVQEQVMTRDINRIATITMKNLSYKPAEEYSKETVEEWNRLQHIKKQLEHYFKDIKETEVEDE